VIENHQVDIGKRKEFLSPVAAKGDDADRNLPTAIPDPEVEEIKNQMSEGLLRPKHRMTFEKGDQVRVVDGPFSNFNGLVEAVNLEKGKVRVLVSIFGRSTPVELDFAQVKKN
jgi:transcriptional antiterminator NusG